VNTRNLTVTLGIALALLVSSCSSGPDAPAVGAGEQVCADAFCITVPDGWVYEVGGTYISANHESAPESTFLTAGVINMEAIVESAGGTWPATTEEVSRSFWALLEEAGVGAFERSARMIGGAQRSWGTHADGDMWHLVYPTGPTSAIGVEIRAPNGSWQSHADAVFESILEKGS
jgi:hypothetical protein